MSNEENSLATYGSVDVGAATEFDKQAKSARLGGSYFKKLPEGKTTIRIMPPRLGQKVPWVVVSEHFLELPTGAVSFVCPVAAGSGRCPACERERQLMSAGDDASVKQAKAFQAKLRYYCNAVDRSCENEGPKVFPFGVMIYKKLYSLLTDPDIGVGDFTSPASGYDLVIVRTGQGQQDTKYDVVPSRLGATPLSKDTEQAQLWLSQMSDLSIKMRPQSFDEIVDLLKNGRRER